MTAAVAACIALLASVVVASPAEAVDAPAAAPAAAVTTDPVTTDAQAVSGDIVKAAAVVGFNAENIISDGLFYDGNAMSAAEIQSFLDAKIGSCQNGKCLNVLSAGISSRAAVTSQTTGNLICSAIQGGTMRVSELIYRVQVACGISAKVILTTLQKEQGLTTSKAPSDWNLSAAMGASCPDTAPCDPAFAGVGPQILKGTQQLKTYKAANFAKQPGRNYIGYSPTASCGGTYLNIQNYATAALYNYTPYQPNAAALAAGYGLGDGCSSYGNRNFYNYYTEWFGSTQTSPAQILRSSTTGVTYLISEWKKYAFPSTERAAQFTWIASTRVVSDADLASYSDGGTAPRAVRTPGGVFLLDSGKRFAIADCGLAKDYGWDCASLPLVMQNQVDVYGDGGYLRSIAAGSDGTWLVQGQKRRQIVDLGLVAAYGIPNVTSPLSATLLGEFALGDPVVSAGIYGDDGGAVVALTGSGGYTVPPAAQTPGIVAAKRMLTSASVARLPRGADLPLRITIGDAQYVIAEAGLLRVDAYNPDTFTELPIGSSSGFPSAGSVSGPHYVREISDSQVYLISGGGLVPVSDRQQADITAQYGVSSKVWVVADGVLPAGTATGVRVVRSSAGTLFLIDGSRRFRLAGCGMVADWARSCDSVANVSDSTLANFTDAGVLQMMVRTAAGPTWLVQSGARREVPDTALVGRYGIPSSTSVISTAALSVLPVGNPVVAPGAYASPAGKTVVISDGGVFSLADDTRLPIVTAGTKKLSAETMATLAVAGALPTRMLSGGRAYVLTEAGWLIVDPRVYGGTSRFESAPDGAWNGVPVAREEQRPHFVRSRGSDQEFLVSGGALQPISNASAHNWIVAHFGVDTTTWTLAKGGLVSMTLPIGQVFRTSDGLRVADGSDIFRLPSCDLAADLGTKCADVPTVTLPPDISVTLRSTLTPLLTDSSGRAWLIQDGTRREVPDVRLLAPFGIGPDVTKVSHAMLESRPIGDPVLAAGTYTDGAGTVRLSTSAGVRYSVPVDVRAGVISDRAIKIDPGSMARFAATGDLPRRIAARGGSFLLSPEGWLAVPAATLGSLSVTASGGDLLDALPNVVGPSTAFFARERSSSQIFLVSGGLQQITDENQKNWVTAIYGVPARVWVVADSVLK